NSARRLMDVDIAGLSDRPGSLRRTKCQSGVSRSLDHRHRGFQCPVEQVNVVTAVKLKPLPIVARSATGHVTKWIKTESLPSIRRLAGRYVRGYQAGISKRPGIGAIHADRKIHVASAICSNSLGVIHRE